MDLKKVAEIVAQSEQARTFTVNRPDGEPYTSDLDGRVSTISHVGKESKRYRAAKDAVMRRNLKMRKLRLDPLELRENRVILAAATVTGWDGWEFGEQPAELSGDNLRVILEHDHILEQLEESIEGHADFFGKSLRG